MKILMIFQSAPLPPPNDLGGAKRNFPFFKENLKRHSVSVVSFGTPDEEKLFRNLYGDICSRIVFVDRRRPRILNGLEKVWLVLTMRSSFNQVYRRKFQQELASLFATDQFDLIHCCYPLFGIYSFPQGVPILSDTHNVESEIIRKTYDNVQNPFFKILFFFDHRFSKKFEIAQCNKFDALIATTQPDRERFQEDKVHGPIYVIQNGVNGSFYEDLGISPDPKTMIFVGAFNWYPNVHALHYFLDEIFPKVLLREPDAKVLVVGAYPPRDVQARSSQNVVVTGYVRDIRPFVARSEVFVIPLLIGSGIRGKALEAMAMKRPIVSTSLGCAGINLRHKESALFADSPEEFAEAILYLFNHESERHRIAQKAHSVVLEEHDWEKKGLELEHVYRSLAPHAKAKSNSASVVATSANSNAESFKS